MGDGWRQSWCCLTGGHSLRQLLWGLLLVWLVLLQMLWGLLLMRMLILLMRQIYRLQVLLVLGNMRVTCMMRRLVRLLIHGQRRPCGVLRVLRHW